MAKASPRPGRTVPGSKKSPQVERREALPCALFPGDPGTRPRPVTVRLSALRFPSQRGGKLKAHLARRRENADAWLFEIVDRKFWHGAATFSASSPRRRGPIRRVADVVQQEIVLKPPRRTTNAR